MEYKKIILSKLEIYLKKKKVKLSRGNIKTFKCPKCGKTANILPNVHLVNCFVCNPKKKLNRYWNLIDIVKMLEKDKQDWDEEKLYQYLKDFLKIKTITKKDKEETLEILKKYKEWEFDLVPIIADGKIPAEKNWTNKSHKDIDEWKTWISEGLNIGIKTGKISGVTILDIDQKPIPEEIKEVMGNPIIQESTNGFHLIYKYDEELPKTRIDDMKIDIENDGGQVVCSPSRIKGVARKFIEIPSKIPQIPKNLKTFLKEKLTIPRKTNSEKIVEDIQTEEFNLGILEPGQRNSSLVRLGGIIRKELSKKQTSYVLSVLNNVLCKNPLSAKEMRAMQSSLEKYSTFDEAELSHKILEYLKDVEEAGRMEIAMAVVGTNRGEDKKRVDKALQYLIKEKYITKKGKTYLLIADVEWKEELINIGVPIDFKMPYFYDVMNFNNSDLLLLGAKTSVGKTHIAVNIIKQLVEQNIKPCYVSLEGGSRWSQIALQLGLKEGDFEWFETSNPQKIKLKDGAVTIIDWLCPKSYAETDKIIMDLNDKVRESKGILIVFVQIRDNGEWFAKDLITQFPALACRYFYEPNTTEYGKFVFDKIRDPKVRIKNHTISCKYDFDTKEFKRVDELDEDNSESGS